MAAKYYITSHAYCYGTIMNDSTPISSLPTISQVRQMAPPIRVGRQEVEHPHMQYEDIQSHPHPFYGNIDRAAVADSLRPMAVDSLSQSQPANQQPRDNHNPNQNPAMYQLPPRDIPMHTIDHQIDPAVHAGYIPPQRPGSRVSDAYIRNHNEKTDRELRDYQSQTYRNRNMETIVDSLQMPILLAILFFVINSDTINQFLFRTFSGYGLYTNDTAQLNVTGLVVKSSLFGFVYYVVDWAVDSFLFQKLK